MARRNIPLVEILEIIYRWHRGDSHNTIQRSLGTDRKTISKYIGIALQADLNRRKPLPSDDEIARLISPRLTALKADYPTPALDRLAPYRERIAAWSKDPGVSIKQMHRLLGEMYPELSIGFTSLRAYIRANFRPIELATTMPLEVSPGQQAQVDFGYAGRLLDPQSGRTRKVWCFVLTLSYSRLRFVHYVFNQKAETWVDCHARAFEHFGGVPRTVLCDNLKAGVTRTDLYDPVINRLYQECERHYGFAVDPAKVRTPEHKGRVERSVAIVNSQVLAGREVRDIDHANELAAAWMESNSRVMHSVTRRAPLEAYDHDERSHMLPLPTLRYEAPRFAQLKVGRDQHVVFEHARYSVPTRYVGEIVEVFGGTRMVRIHHDSVSIKLHEPAAPGETRTDPLDFPEAARYFMTHPPAACQARADAIGESCARFVEQALSPGTVTGLRKAQKILRLAERHGDAILEAACRQAASYENWHIASLEGILKRKTSGTVDGDSEAPEVIGPLPVGYNRSANYFAHDTSGVEASA